MATKTRQKFIDLDKEREQSASVFKIGDIRWRAEEPNLRTLKSILDETTDTEGLSGVQLAKANYEGMLEQLTGILKNEETGVPPDVDFLSDHLGPKGASRILDEVLGEGQ